MLLEVCYINVIIYVTKYTKTAPMPIYMYSQEYKSKVVKTLILVSEKVNWSTEILINYFVINIFMN